MKIFVTGATGFIGRHLIRRLSHTEHDVVCLVRRSSSTAVLREHGARLQVGDVTDKASFRAAMAGCDCVVNLANVYSMWEPDKSVFRSVNVGGTRNVMECALEAGVRKVVHVSTAGVYGRPADCPFDETSEVGPERFSLYTRTKYEGDLVAWDLFRTNGLPLVVLYPGAVLGPGDTKPTGKYIEDLAAGRMPVTVYEDVVMTYVYVLDVAEAIVLAVERENNIGEKYLVGKYELSFGELNKLVGDISGVRLPSVRLPGFLTLAAAALLTSLSAFTRRPPPWGMSLDQARMARHGFRFDGSKAEKELGLRYTPMREALEDAIMIETG
jgi:dihydroflavonol-4-reductase